MNDFQHIQFPVDFSAGCESAIPYVTEMVHRYAAKLTLLHVIESPPLRFGSMPEDPYLASLLAQESFEAGHKRLLQFRAEQLGDLVSQTATEVIAVGGDPGDAILAQAEIHPSGLIMMPTHGYGPVRTLFVGSTTAKVLHRAKCPVWTGAGLDNPRTTPYAHIQNILCALDLEKESAHVIQGARAIAEKFSARIQFLHCVPAPESGSPADFAFRFDRFLADAARDKIREIQAREGTDFKVHLQGGDISTVVRDAVARRHADLLVIGRGHVQAPLSRLRSNAYAIIRDTPCPVLSL